MVSSMNRVCQSPFSPGQQDFSVPGVLESPLGEAGKKRLKKVCLRRLPVGVAAAGDILVSVCQRHRELVTLVVTEGHRSFIHLFSRLFASTYESA